MRAGWVAWAVVLAASAAQADVRGALEPQLRLGAGYDDNLFLDASPSGSQPSQLRADAVFDVEPRLFGRLAAGGHQLTLSADYLERITLANRDLHDLVLRLDWLSPAVGRIGRVDVVAAALYEHYAADLFPGDTFDLAGGEGGVRVRAGERVVVDVRYRGDARLYSDPSRLGQLDAEHRALAWMRVHAHRVIDLALGYTFLELGSTEPTARLERHRGDLLVTLQPVAWLQLTAGYGLYAQHLPSALLASGATGSRDDLAHQLDVFVSARPKRWLELWLRYDLLSSTSTDASGLWRRNQVIGGLAFQWPVEKSFKRPPPEAPLVEGTRVTFRFRGAAERVSVVGDWNAWDPLQAPLARVGDGRFEATYTLPPGRHEYALSVDGTLQAPRDAAGYLDDGFGGKNGLVDVP